MRTIASSIKRFGEESARIKYSRYMSGSNELRGSPLGTIAKVLGYAHERPISAILRSLQEKEHEHYQKLLKGKK